MGYVNCFAIIFLASFFIPKKHANFLNNKILVKLDEYSFTVYLGHALILELMNIIRSLVTFNKVVVLLFFSIGTVVVCFLLQICVVKPFIAIERKLLNEARK